MVSGLALGIDTAAHEGALRGGGRTVAVLGTGVDVIYPAANSGLAARILAAGGTLVSQFPDGTAPRRANFPRRNWTLAALSDMVVVVEAAEHSGTLITAAAARAQGKRLMAVPGSVFSPLSIGCHQLLRNGARLVENASDVLTELAAGGTVDETPPQPAGPGPGLPSSGWQYIAGTDTAGVTHNVSLPVAPGDVLRFIVNKNGSRDSDETSWNPTITYTG